MFSLESFKSISKESVPFFATIILILTSFAELSQIIPYEAMAIPGGKNGISITITNPPQNQNQTILTNFATINGTTHNSGNSEIKEVSVLVSRVPINSSIQYKLAVPSTRGNWSSWSFPVVLNSTGSYLVEARSTDIAGNQAYSGSIIFSPPYVYNKRVEARSTESAGNQTYSGSMKFSPPYVYNKKVAFVEPTFTYAAYRNGSFYNFYAKYSLTDTNNKTITKDLNLLENRSIPHGPFPYFAHPSYSDIPYISYFQTVLDHVKRKDPSVTHLTDADVSQGKIFRPDGKNAYDVLFLFHNEYETQAEYNNLRQFVTNGGTIVFTEANVFFAEVSYNKTNDSISLVRGHYWKLGSNGATPSVSERWLNESREWMGSNFFDVDSNLKVKFGNNPFNYTHSEEQYVTNPKAKIMIDYKAYDIPATADKKFQNATVATYQMDYGKGRVINLGIWGHIVENNQAFLNYLDNVIIPLALGK